MGKGFKIILIIANIILVGLNIAIFVTFGTYVWSHNEQGFEWLWVTAKIATVVLVPMILICGTVIACCVIKVRKPSDDSSEALEKAFEKVFKK